MSKQTFLNEKLITFIDLHLRVGYTEDELINLLDEKFDLDIDWRFIRDGISEKHFGRLADWEKKMEENNYNC